MLKFLIFDTLLKFQPKWVVLQELSCIFWFCQYFKRFRHTPTFGKSWHSQWLNPRSLHHGCAFCFPLNPFLSLRMYLCSLVNTAEDLVWPPHVCCRLHILSAVLMCGPAQGYTGLGCIATCCNGGKRSQSYSRITRKLGCFLATATHCCVPLLFYFFMICYDAKNIHSFLKKFLYYHTTLLCAGEEKAMGLYSIRGEPQWIHTWEQVLEDGSSWDRWRHRVGQ